MCDGSGPCAAGQVRLLPLGSIPDHGNLILCASCFANEIRYRRERNLDLAPDCRFKLPLWSECEVYGEEQVGAPK
jgi:hypothetical protein